MDHHGWRHCQGAAELETACQTPLQLLAACRVLSVLENARSQEMRQIIAAIALATPLAMLPCIAGAKGCLKGAAVGGVVGHVAGHHAVVGAAAGCVIEHHREKMKDKAAKQNSASQNRTAGVATPAPGQ
jgi:hypothetical protein